MEDLSMITTLILAAAVAGQAPARPAPAAAARPRPAPAAQAQAEDKAADARRMIAKRKAKKSARYVAATNREASEAQARAIAADRAAREYKQMLPYMLENQRQMLQRQSAMESNVVQAQRNNILDRALNGGGVVVGAPSPPPRIVNMPGQPYAN